MKATKSTTCIALVIATIVSSAHTDATRAATTQPTTRPHMIQRPQGPPPAPNEVARLTAQGKRTPFVHDPSTVVRCKDEFWVYSTGNGIPSWHSLDLINWSRGPRVLDAPPDWIAQAVPLHRGNGYWAPDLIKVADDRYLLFYSVSTFGKQTSAIAVAHNATLDPSDPAFRWTDDGIVIASNEHADFNAIDPSVMHDADGKLWMTVGSYWSGIKMIELDPRTGKRASDAKPIAIANKRSGIEASFLTRHDDKYFLFVNWGSCCKGVNSTYEIRVGRSENVEGPYVDRDGKQLLDGGGTSVLASDGKFIGPGHAGIVVDGDGEEWLSCHYYDATEGGASHLAIRPLTWDAAGWPSVGDVPTR